jgi:hypothetical protein
LSKAKAWARCFDYRRFGGEMIIKGKSSPKLKKCSHYLGPHKELHMKVAGGPEYQDTLATKDPERMKKAKFASERKKEKQKNINQSLFNFK